MPRGNVLAASVFEDHVGKSLVGSVGEGERDIPGAEFDRDLSGLAVELQGRALSSGTDDFDVAPADAPAPAGAKSLHARFLGGEAGGVAFKAAGLRLAIADFSFGENAAQEAFAVALNRCADARDFSDIDTSAEDHEDIVNGDWGVGNL